MVAEVVNHLHAPCFATKLQPPRNPGKTLECTLDFRRWHIVKPRRHRCHRSIVDIESANERNFKSVFSELEPGTFRRVNDIADSLPQFFEKPTSIICARQSFATSTQLGSSPFKSTMPF